MTHQLNTDPRPVCGSAAPEPPPRSEGVHHRKCQRCHDGVHTIENQGVMPDQTTGPVSGPDFQAPGGVTATPAGPRRCTLEQLAAACDSALFAAAGCGEVRLVAPKARLAEVLGCSPQALSSRVDRLCAAGLARRTDGGLLVDIAAVAERLDRLGAAASVGSAEAHRRFADVFAAADPDPGAAAGQLYRRGDGSSASLSDLAAAGGFSSRGTAAYHLPRRHRRPAQRGQRQSSTVGHAAAGGDMASDGPQQLAAALVALVADTVAAVAPLLNGGQAAESVARLAALGDALASPRDDTGSRATQPVAVPEHEPVAASHEMSMRDTYNSSHAHLPVEARDDTGSRATQPVAAGGHEPVAAIAEPDRLRERQLTAALAGLAAEAARRQMAPVNMSVVCEAAAGYRVEDVAAAADVMVGELDSRPIVNLGGLLVKALQRRDPHYFPPPPAPLPARARQPVFDPAVCSPADGDVSAEENSRRLGVLRDAAGRAGGRRAD